MKDKELQVISPDGVVGTIPESSLKQAVEMGYREATAQDVEDHHTRQDARSTFAPVKVFVGQALDEFGLGAVEASIDVAAENGVEAAQRAKRVKDIYKEENPIANTVGGVVGFGAQAVSTMGTGALAKVGASAAKAASGAGLTRAGIAVAGKAGGKLVARTAAAAGEGMALSAAANLAPAVTEVIVGDPAEAVEKFVASAGLGALLGGGFGAAAQVTAKTVEGVVRKTGNRMSETAANEAARVAGLTPTQIINLEKYHGFSVRDVGKYLLDNGIVSFGDDGVASLTKLGTKMEEVGHNIGNVLREADRISPGTGPQLESVVSKAIDKIRDEAKGAISEKSLDKMRNSVFDVLEGHKFDSRESLQAFKVSLGTRLQKAFEKDFVSDEKQGLLHLYDGIKRELEESVTRAIEHAGPMEVKNLARYKDLKREYELLSSLDEGFQKQAARALSPSGSLLEKLKSSPMAMFGALLGGGLGVAASSVGTAVPAALLGAIASNYLRRRSGSSLASILNKASEFEFKMPKLGSLVARKAPSQTPFVLPLPRFQEVSKEISTNEAAPEAYLQRMPNTDSSPVQGAMNNTAVAAQSFLYSKLPKNPLPNPFNPEEAYEPSQSELVQFSRYYHAVHNPGSVLENMTPEGVEVLKSVYPALYKELVAGLSEHFAGKKPSFKERLALSDMFDVPENKLLMFLQSSFSNPQSSPRKGGGPVQTSLSEQTPVERVEER